MKRGIVWLIGLWAMQWANAAEVVVYTSLDQVFSQPVLEDFERETGIAVRAVYDVEAAKTTGLVNRLIAETSRPQADVFWNSEVGRTLVLKAKGVLAPYPSPAAEGIPASFKDPEHNWTGFAARARVFIYNTQQLSAQEVPQSILDLAAPRFPAGHARRMLDAFRRQRALQVEHRVVERLPGIGMAPQDQVHRQRACGS